MPLVGVEVDRRRLITILPILFSDEKSLEAKAGINLLILADELKENLFCRNFISYFHAAGFAFLAAAGCAIIDHIMSPKATFLGHRIIAVGKTCAANFHTGSRGSRPWKSAA